MILINSLSLYNLTKDTGLHDITGTLVTKEIASRLEEISSESSNLCLLVIGKCPCSKQHVLLFTIVHQALLEHKEEASFVITNRVLKFNLDDMPDENERQTIITYYNELRVWEDNEDNNEKKKKKKKREIKKKIFKFFK